MTTKELYRLWKQWQNSPKTERFGQHVVNTALTGVHTELFYEENSFKALRMAMLLCIEEKT